jgi:hypothetical protein
MAQDTTYKSLSWVFDSKGLMARPATDRPPNEHFYLNMAGALEREESAMSTRYGSTMLTRDPAGAGFGQNNYLLPSPPVILARMLSLYGASYRYVSLADGTLWRRSGTGQGAYSRIASGLSGNRYSTLVLTCFGSALPFTFFWDSVAPCKDSGVGSPTTIGIAPPVVPLTSLPYAPQILPIDSFQSATGYGATGTLSTAATITANSGSNILSGNYEQYVDLSLSYAAAPDGMIGLSTTLPDGALRLKFNSNRNNNTYDIVALNNAYVPTDSFVFKQVEFSFASNTTTSIGKTVALNLGKYQASDLIVLVMNVASPANVSQITVQFDVNGSGYTSSYYTKSIVPVSYQGNLSLPQTNDPTSAVVDEVFNLATGITNLGQLGQATNLPSNDPNMPLIQPSQMSSGEGSWSVVYLQLGDFLPVGNAGGPGADWSAITGWEVQVVTNNQGATNIAFNGLYVQGSPTASGVGTNAGASSFGGVGYDLRYTYYDATTMTESNGCMLAQFSVTQSNPGGSSTLVVLRQAINAQGQYSANPRVTHVRIYVRGGLYGTNWFYADQFVNVVGGGTFNYKYILPDSALSQGNILNLQNDVPVTSTLQNPVNTTLTDTLNPAPLGTNFPTLLNVIVADPDAVFVAGQIVVIGTPQNLEQCFVVTPGTGIFTCYIFLPHAIGEQVQAFSQPAVACNLAASGYGQVWLAGDPNNPHFLYYTPQGYPENCPPENYIPSPGGPSDPITAVYNFRGTIFVRTHSTHYQVFPGSPPYMQSTGSKHGSPASFDWCITENEVWELGFDGIRSFKGSDGPYRSLIIEWLFRNNPITPVPLVNLSLLSNVISTFKNNTVTFVYTGVDGNQHRLRWSQSYQRFRNDDVPATAMIAEEDTNQLLYSVPMDIDGDSGWAIVYEDITKDYDDGGWSGGILRQLPIALDLQTPYFDEGKPNNQKQYNNVTIDSNPNGSTITVQLLFDDNNGEVAPITLGTFTGPVRDKFQFAINEGAGQQAYRTSLQLTAAVTSAPIIYQADIETAVLPEQRTTYDCYWIKFGQDESKLVKQGYFDVTNVAPVLVNLFADGSDIPYYTFTLPPNPTRSEMPTRVRFPAIKLRLFRVIMASASADQATNQFMLWSAIQIDNKPIQIGKGYNRSELVSQ